ncbi:transposase [Granulicella mallensis]|uniref:Transposase n=1 Tax=Granulicella mallensis TaxID=940614 RepID=A0A7W8E9T0_9BACT|nr:transposase [Granulicella mallensis]
MKPSVSSLDTSLELKALVFQMHTAGCTQDAIAAYVGKSKGTINEMLKPLQKGKKNEIK